MYICIYMYNTYICKYIYTIIFEAAWVHWGFICICTYWPDYSLLWLIAKFLKINFSKYVYSSLGTNMHEFSGVSKYCTICFIQNS